MSSDVDQDDDLDLSTRLNMETAVIAWSELVKHFARGAVIRVAETVDLVEAAVCVIEDDTQKLQTWLDSGVVTRASDDDARDWTTREPDFWCVVTAPWVLVQERPDSSTEPKPPTIH